MKAIVLTGGSGTRLRPFTHTTQKQLLPVANKPVLEFVINDIKDAGIDEIGLVIGGNYPDKIKEHLGDGTEYGVDLTYISQGPPRGLADAVRYSEGFVSDEPFIVYFGDTIIDGGITQRLVEKFDPADQPAFIPLQKVSEPSRFGIAEFKQNEIVAVHEKPEEPPSDFAYMGVIGFTPLLYDVISNLYKSDRGEIELTDAIDALIKRNRNVQWEIMEGTWIDVGTPEDLLTANKHKLEQEMNSIQSEESSEKFNDVNTQVGPGCYIEEDVSIKGPVSIGREVTISKGANVGPYVSIGAGCIIEKASIEQSVILNGTTISADKSLKNSVIGPNASIIESAGETGKVLISEDSRVTF